MSTRLRSTRGLPLGATALVALAAVGAGFVLLQGEPGPPLPMAGPGSVAMSPAEADPVRAAPAQAAQLAATPREAAPACPFQQLEIALAGAAPLRACVDATRVQQNGGVRSYGAAGSGTAGWALQVDVAGGAVLKASLQAGDGRRFGCEGGACAGLGLGRHDARG
ncbi:MAG TPA: hypothetical protein VLA16_26510, partial [Ideonella sp.]|nr:hypothetical protein [Ideonella sp.]